MRRPIGITTQGTNRRSVTVIFNDGSIVTRAPKRGKNDREEMEIQARLIGNQPVEWEWVEGEPLPGTPAAHFGPDIEPPEKPEQGSSRTR